MFPFLLARFFRLNEGFDDDTAQQWDGSRRESIKVKKTHGEEGVDDVGLYGAQRFVSDHDEDLLLFLQVDEVPKPGLLSQPAG